MIYAENIFLCIAIPLGVGMIFLKGWSRRFVLGFLIGMGLCLLSAYISGYLSLVTGMPTEDVALYLSPVVEECMKFLPLLFLLYVFRPEEDAVFLWALSLGIGFATFENCCYILSAGAESLIYTLIRGMAVGVMHLVSMMILALGLVLIQRLRIFSPAGIMGALSLSMSFHALYNLLVSQPGLPAFIGYAMPLVTAVVLYFPFRRITETPEKVSYKV